jgi:hypothetical protein
MPIIKRTNYFLAQKSLLNIFGLISSLRQLVLERHEQPGQLKKVCKGSNIFLAFCS